MAQGGEHVAAELVAGEFWDFSLAVYAWPGVSEAALRLQDEAGKDVNIALACLFAGLARGSALDPATLGDIVTSVEPWTEAAIRPLRAARRQLKKYDADPDSAALRRRVQAMELEAERLAQRRIAAVLPPSRDEGSFDIARANLLLYAGDAAQPLLAALREGMS
jgi:uncharacterized protein (TIGR02444 family)